MNTEGLAQAIVDLHGSRLGLPDWTPLAAALDPATSAIEQAVRRACHRMGFDDVDSAVLGAAWQRQSQRLGRFDPGLWPAEPVDFGLSAWPRTQGFAPCPQELGLYVVIPDAAWVARMARCAVPTLQLRFKSSDPAAIEREVRAAVRAVRGSESLLFINDHWQAALGAGAYGVHLGQEDLDRLSAQDLQTLQGSGLRLGLSTHGYAEMLRADAVTPSYIAMGAVFPTTLKRMVTAAQGPARLQHYSRLMRAYPQVAIGGIDEDRLPSMRATGVGSVAVVRAVTGASDPQAAARRLMRCWAQLCARRADTPAMGLRKNR